MSDRIKLSDVAAYTLPNCPYCGQPVDQSWVDVTCRADSEPWVMPGRYACHTPECPMNGETRQEGCTCPFVDATVLGRMDQQTLIGLSRDCEMHSPTEDREPAVYVMPDEFWEGIE